MPEKLNIRPHEVPLRLTNQGVYVVGASRVSLDSVIGAFLAGASAEDVVSQYPTLELADVYAIIAFYLRKRTEVDAYLSDRRTKIDAFREQWNATPQAGALRERLLAQRRSRGAG